MEPAILDVRERDEFEAEHVEHSLNVPLSCFAAVAPGVLNQLGQREIVILCRSGVRARLATDQVARLGYADKVRTRVFEGGLLEWKRQGRPTLEGIRSHLPIMRQVQLVAGLSILSATLLGAWVSPWFLGVSAFFGSGLAVAGATGFCGMARLLAWMPWNKTAKNRDCAIGDSV